MRAQITEWDGSQPEVLKRLIGYEGSAGLGRRDHTNHQARRR